MRMLKSILLLFGIASIIAHPVDVVLNDYNADAVIALQRSTFKEWIDEGKEKLVETVEGGRSLVEGLLDAITGTTQELLNLGIEQVGKIKNKVDQVVAQSRKNMADLQKKLQLAFNPKKSEEPEEIKAAEREYETEMENLTNKLQNIYLELQDETEKLVRSALE